MNDTPRMFQVRGWERRAARSGRFPYTLMKIEALDGKMAAWIYASDCGIKTEWWWNAGPDPIVVIRVSEEGEQAP